MPNIENNANRPECSVNLPFCFFTALVVGGAKGALRYGINSKAAHDASSSLLMQAAFVAIILPFINLPTKAKHLIIAVMAGYVLGDFAASLYVSNNQFP